MIALLSLLALGSIDEVTLTSSYYNFRQGDPGYEEDVRYRFKFQGLGHYQVNLEKWKWVDDGFGQGFVLQETYSLITVAALRFEGFPEQSHRVGTLPLEGLEALGPVGGLTLDEDAILDPGVGSHIPKFQSKGNRLVALSLPALQRRFRGTFAPRIADVSVDEVIDDWEGGFNRYKVTRFKVYGNQVQSVGLCGEPNRRIVRLDRHGFKTQQRRGVGDYTEQGDLRGRCVNLYDPQGRLLLRTKF